MSWAERTCSARPITAELCQEWPFRSRIAPERTANMATPGQDRVERRLAGIVKTTGGGALLEFRRSSDRDAHSIAQDVAAFDLPALPQHGRAQKVPAPLANGQERTTIASAEANH